jgi:hypothetical protein
VRNVITAENDTNLARWSPAKRTSVCVAKSAPQDVATGTNVEFFFPPARAVLDLMIIRSCQPS